MKDNLQYIQFAITVVVLVVTASIGYERTNSVANIDIAIIKQKVEAIEANTKDLKTMVNLHVEKSNEVHQSLEKRLNTLEIRNTFKTDNTRVAYSYIVK